MFHRCKDYFLDQDAYAGEDTSVVLRDATARTKLGQGFKLTNAGLVEFIDVKIFKTTTPVGNFWFTIETNNAGVPSGTVLATSDKYDVSRLSAASTISVRIPFRTPASLSSATQYHLVLQGDFTIGASNMTWRCDGTSPTYANGTAATYDGANWTADAAKDFCFRMYVTRNDVAVTMPSLYTQKAKIGYACNNGSSNLKHFWAKDRTVFCGYDTDWNVGALSAASITLTDLGQFIPPVPVTMWWNTEVSVTSHACFGPLTATDLVSDATTGARPGASFATLVSGYAGFQTLNLDKYQGMMVISANGTVSALVGTFTW
jgi:hypothetical protein